MKMTVIVFKRHHTSYLAKSVVECPDPVLATGLSVDLFRIIYDKDRFAQLKLVRYKEW